MKFNKLIPELSVSDFEKTLEFYIKIIGFEIKYTREKFAFLSFNGSQIMIQEVNKKWKTGILQYHFGRGINFQIEVKTINPVIISLKKNRYQLFRNPEDNWYRKGKQLIGCREFLVQDPDGYLLRFSQIIGIKPAKP